MNSQIYLVSKLLFKVVKSCCNRSMLFCVQWTIADVPSVPGLASVEVVFIVPVVFVAIVPWSLFGLGS